MPADLGQVVGGMLAGIAEARSLGDRYTRALAIAYEQDDLLRAFPVPRAEIADLNIELHFAIDALSAAPPPQVGALLDQTTKAIVTGVVGALTKLRIRRAASTIDKLISSAIRAELEKSTIIAGAVPEGASAVAFDADRLTTIALARLADGRVATTPNLQIAIREAVVQAGAAHVQAVADLRAAGAFTGLFLSINVTHQELAALPPETVSVAKLSLGIRNYEWHQVDVADGQPVRKLVPE